MSSPAFLRKLVPVLLQRKVFKPINVTGTVCPFEQGLQVNPFLFILFNIKHPDHLLNLVSHYISLHTLNAIKLIIVKNKNHSISLILSYKLSLG